MNIYEDYNRAKKVNRQLAITLISSHVSVRDFIKFGAVILHTCSILLRLPLHLGLKPITHIILWDPLLHLGPKVITFRTFVTFRVIYFIWGLNTLSPFFSCRIFGLILPSAFCLFLSQKTAIFVRYVLINKIKYPAR